MERPPESILTWKYG